MTSPIRAFIFDLDGTLLETEQLKAEAYADVIGRLNGSEQPEQGAIDLYRAIVGSTDRAVCKRMIEKFNLMPKLNIAAGEEPWQALHRVRMERYRAAHGTPGKLRAVQYPHNVALARRARADGMRVAVATMSFSDEAKRVIKALGLDDVVETVVGVDDVKNEKPAPDAFLLAMERLGVSPGEALIVEDSPAGTRAAIASGARWLCVPTRFSRAAVRQADDIDQRWIVGDVAELDAKIAERLTPRAD
jgi:beta-phosphoglucomutase-like phosphatase (HAD superfamily)